MSAPSSNPWDRLRRDLKDEEAQAPAVLPRTIGKYAIVREISHTGSSVVYLARDPELGRKLAIKVLREDCVLPEFIQRFRHEGEIAASLRHPNIVTLHDVGIAANESGLPVHYLVMDYVEGGTLSGGARPPREAARILAEAADGIEFAHRAGIIHRDLKPANILLDREGHPQITDFGLAKAGHAASVQTRQGAVMGTPRYMAPEQVRGESAKLDARTDVYALGAILYELVAGTPPFADENIEALFRKIVAEKPKAPSLRAPAIPRELDAIILRALQKDPARRYGAAEELARDLRRFLAGFPVLSRPPSALGRIFRRALRGRSAPGVAVLLGTLILVTAGLFTVRRLAHSAGVREKLAAALRWEAQDEPAKARDDFREVLALEPAHEEARAGLGRVLLELQDLAASGAPTDPYRLSWVELGGSASGGGVSNNPKPSYQVTLALGPEGNPFLAWRDYSSNADEIFLRYWNGKTWAELDGSATGGGVSRTPTPSAYPSLAVDKKGHPWVAWAEACSGVENICVRNWDGTAWRDVGGSPQTGGISRWPPAAASPSIALGREGRPVVAWHANWEGKLQIHLRRWNGTSWEELGGSATGAGISRTPDDSRLPCLALDPQDRPVVAWLVHERDHREVHVRRWDGESWRDVGPGRVGGVITGPGWAHSRPSLAIDRSGNPVVAWADYADGGPVIYLKRWNGNAWEELGGSASGRGVSRTPGKAFFSSVALDERGFPIVAWEDQSTGGSQICLRRWTGRSWVELAGSATGGGVSRGEVTCGGAIVVLDRGSPVVAWVKNLPGNEEVCLRRFVERPPTRLRQLRPDRTRIIAKGGSVQGSGVLLQARIGSSVEAASVRLEVEIVPTGAPWTEKSLVESADRDGEGWASVEIQDVPPGPKRWRARTLDSLGMNSPWVAFDSGEVGPDFSIVPP